MSCGPAEASFRLLDRFVGWDEASVSGIGGLDDPGGLYLLPALIDTLGEGELDARIPPRQLARGCGGCEWFLAATGCPDALLVRDGCGQAWRPARFTPKAAAEPWSPSAVAAWGDQVAVACARADRVWLFDLRRGSSPVVVPVRAPVAAAFGARALYVAAADGIVELDRSGAVVGLLPLPAGVAPAALDRLAVVASGAIWLIVRAGEAYRAFVYAPRVPTALDEGACAGGAATSASHAAPRAASGDELAAAFPASGVRTWADGFCLVEPAAHGTTVTSCFDGCGTPVVAGAAAPAGPARLETGVLVTTALDSGQPRCRWHRVRVDADLPPGTSLTVEVASSEDELASPHDDDWTGPGAGRTDFLIAQPPGRFLFVRLTVRGDGLATPRVRRLHIDLPRASSLDRLPSVYREDPEAADFSERFLALFDAHIEELDRAIERFPALLDVGGVPDDVLPWLASLIGVAFDPAWEPARRRALLLQAPELHRRRGTVRGLRQVIELVLGVEPIIEEVAATRAFGALRAGSRLGSVRLYGKSRARFQVGRSKLGGAPVRSYGDPDDDVLRAGAYRIRVRVPPVPGATRAQAEARLRRLVEAQKPAHVAVESSVGGGGGVLGLGLILGVDTVFAPPPAPVLGRAGNIRLNRASLLWRARREP